MTGASGGLGKRFAKSLAGEGVTKLVLAARNKDKLEQGFTLTCAVKPTSDVVIQTHAEDDLF